MKTYTAHLKGTQKNSTYTIHVKINANNKGQAFNMAYHFFEKGETDTIFGTPATGLSTIGDWIPGAENMKHLAGKYKVHNTSISID